MIRALRWVGSTCLDGFRLILGRSNRRGMIHILVARALAVMVVALLARQYSPYQPVIVMGSSMMPTLQSHQLVVIDRSYDRIRSTRRNDVVVFRLGGDIMVKRVTGVPGDSLWLMTDQKPGMTRWSILVASKDVHSCFEICKRLPYKLVRIRVPKGCVFVTGDNVGSSVDSRQFGCVSERQIVGRVCYPRIPNSEAQVMDMTYRHPRS